MECLNFNFLPPPENENTLIFHIDTIDFQINIYGWIGKT